MKPIWRKVVESIPHDNPGFEKSRFVGGSYAIQLECGHTLRRKQSQGVPCQARCRYCEDLRSGNGVRTTYDTQNQTAYWETWDKVRQWPVPHTRPMTAQEVARWKR